MTHGTHARCWQWAPSSRWVSSAYRGRLFSRAQHVQGWWCIVLLQYASPATLLSPHQGHCSAGRHCHSCVSLSGCTGVVAHISKLVVLAAGPPRHGRGARQVQGGSRRVPEQPTAVEQHRHVFLRQAGATAAALEHSCPTHSPNTWQQQSLIAQFCGLSTPSASLRIFIRVPAVVLCYSATSQPSPA